MLKIDFVVKKTAFVMKKMLPVFAGIALLSSSACVLVIGTVTALVATGGSTAVTYQNYANAQSSMQMNDYQKLAEGVNKWFHIKTPTSIDLQPTIRMNRDTLYSIAVVNVSKGTTVTLPDAGKRYMSLMPVNEFGYTNFVYYGKGEYKLSAETVGSDYAIILIRTLVDANDPKDIEAVNKLQDSFKVTAEAKDIYKMPKWDMASYTKVFNMLVALFALEDNTDGMFGTKETVDPIGLLLGAAGGFGGLPSKDAQYFNIIQPKKGKAFKMVLKDVPVNGFWSVSIYNKEGYFFKSKNGAANINNLIATPGKDGSYTLYFGDCKDEKVNCLAIEDGWNSILRLYQPKKAILSGKWKIPQLIPIK